MLSYELTKDAEADLEEIIRYTTLTWGLEQAERYFKTFNDVLTRLVLDRTPGSPFINTYPRPSLFLVNITMFFYLLPKQSKPQIIAVFHERMDLMHRLKERFE